MSLKGTTANGTGERGQSMNVRAMGLPLMFPQWSTASSWRAICHGKEAVRASAPVLFQLLQDTAITGQQDGAAMMSWKETK